MRDIYAVIICMMLLAGFLIFTGCVGQDTSIDNTGIIGAQDYHTDKYHHSQQDERDSLDWNNGESIGRDHV